MRGDIIQSSHRFHEPCSACGDGDVTLEYHNHEPSPPLYTLTDLRALATEYADERHCEAKLAVQLSLSCFCEWIQRQEQGKEQRNGA